jgi:integral membrane protein (TIGR00529 family)
MIWKLASVFALVIVLMSVRLPISAAIGAGAILIGILFSMPALDIGGVFLTSLIDLKTVNLIAVVFFITFLGRMMKEVGALSRFANGAAYMVRGSRVGLVSVPMFVGLLPMPGGALLTAPMIAEQAKSHGIAPGLLTYLNYWFRHVWEYFWPLYPPVILGMAILGIPHRHFIINQSYMTVAAIAVGTFVLFTFVKPRQVRPERTKGKPRLALKDILYGAFPVFAVMLLIAIQLVIQRVSSQDSSTGSVVSQFSLSASMLVVIVFAFFVYRVPVRDAGKLVSKALNWRVLTVLVAVMFFKEMLTESPALAGFEQMVQTAPSSVLPLLVMALPFLVGLLVGLNQAYVGVAFPLLAPFIVHEPGLIMLAYVFGFLGCLLSPAHLCLAFSRTYFKASWGSVYKWLLPSVFALAGIALGVWFLFF